jgi:hypothetical protein
VKASQTPSCTKIRLAQTQVWPAFPVFRGDRPLDRHLDIGIVENDKRGIASQFERQFLHRARPLFGA